MSRLTSPRALLLPGLLLASALAAAAQEPPPRPFLRKVNLAEYVKEFNDDLVAYPKGTLADTEDVLYWTKDTFGLKPVVSAYHLTLHKGPRGAIIANELLYSSHFFNASLEMMAGVPTPDGKGLYLLSLFRTRLDPPTGMLSGVLVAKVGDGLETGVRENLKRARERLAAP